MGKFDCLLKTSSPKKKFYSNFYELYKKSHIDGDVDYAYFENLNIQDLLNMNKKRKYDTDLIALWGQLEMKKFIEYESGITINPYLTNGKTITIKELPNLKDIPEDAQIHKLLDINYVKSLVLEGIEFKDIYFVIFEIMDLNYEYRPYVIVFTKNTFGKFFEIGHGYDTNNNGNVELFISSFNYPVFLTPKGMIELPLANKKIKLQVYDYLNDDDIEKLQKNK